MSDDLPMLIACLAAGSLGVLLLTSWVIDWVQAKAQDRPDSWGNPWGT